MSWPTESFGIALLASRHSSSTPIRKHRGFDWGKSILLKECDRTMMLLGMLVGLPRDSAGQKRGLAAAHVEVGAWHSSWPASNESIGATRSLQCAQASAPSQSLVHAKARRRQRARKNAPSQSLGLANARRRHGGRKSAPSRSLGHNADTGARTGATWI